MTALVMDNLPLLAAAPNGMLKLRSMIRQMAMRGRLVGPTVPALTTSELQEKRADWTWTTLATAGRWAVGNGFPTTEQGKLGLAVLFCKVSDMNLAGNEKYIVETNNTIDYETAARLRVNVHPAGTVVFPKIGGAISTNKRRILSKPTAIDNNCLGIAPNEDVSTDYLYLFLQSVDFALYQAGTSVPALSQSVIGQIEFLLPPLAEQARIVAKVDELMALCDRLEAEQADAEAAHVQLVEALLASLTQARDAADFRASWQQLAEHFHTLFTTEASIDALQNTVLRLGVMGKLVAHAHDGESAEQLLARIADSRKERDSSGSVDDSVAPYKVPDDWCWTNLPAVGELARGKSKHRPRNDPALYSGGTIPLVQTGDVARANGLISTSTGKYNAAGLAQSRLWPAGTMCITIAANIADTAILGFDACFPDSVVGFIPGLPEINVKYFEYFLRTAKADLQKFAPSTAQKNINLDILGKLCVPLPPLAELNRIVTKVDELLALCDQLKLKLAQARQHHAQLASVLVEQAVAA